ncbi:u-box domain-containing protein [Diplodia corticola]|uniref:U-box domain-containing protein n=1 Tax=Diplodia corticola TaxID=236234 RepID=A0A1J9QZQ8_9PEZI|nr:u-box domain-containing protein [Diplodia corticola]OJD33474.1 u-box domain-containing protein [Diplodia corticola]
MASLPVSLKKELPDQSATMPGIGAESPPADDKDWEMIDEGSPMAGQKIDPTSVGLDIHRLQGSDGMAISVRSPKKTPTILGEKQRFPVDIVLVIDISTSMASFVECPKEQDGSSGTGNRSGNEPSARHSILDLVKNATLAIIENLDERDRLGIVTFGYDAEVISSSFSINMNPNGGIQLTWKRQFAKQILQELTYMTCEARESLMTKIQTVGVHGATNMWAGLRKGYQMLSSEGQGPVRKPDQQALSAIYLLTDGQPNVMPPAEGYVPALRKLVSRGVGKGCDSVIPSLHTFGFGYSLRSGLLQAMAEVGGGYYGFIPNGFLMATIFTHAIANLFATFTTSASLKVTVSGCSKMPEPLKGAVLCRSKEDTLDISLYNLQYGQTREIVLSWPTNEDKSNQKPITIAAALEYTGPGLGSQRAEAVMEASQIPAYPNRALAKYHAHRSLVCEFLASLSKQDAEEEYLPIPAEAELDDALSRLDELIQKIKASAHAGSDSQEILFDLGSGLEEARASAGDPAGQVFQALFRPEYYQTWGKHYLPSLLHAYRNQLCINDKDQGPKTFVKNNPLFAKFKEAQSDSWDKAGDRLMEIVKKQAQAGAGPRSHSRVLPSVSRVSMAAYNSPHNPCFAGPSRVLLSSGQRVPVRLIRRGASVLTPAGPRRVAAVVQTSLSRVALCKLGGLLVTPWHPILDAQSKEWVFPAMVADARVRRGVKVYSLLLERSYGPEAHAVNVGGHWCVTLGHGKTEMSAEDVRGHEFFGDYAKVMRELKRLPKGSDGLFRCGGMARDGATGLACGFKKPIEGHGRAQRRNVGHRVMGRCL